MPADVAAVADCGVADALRDRTFIDVPQYERLARGGDAGGEPPADFAGDFFFTGIEHDRREYARRRALAA